MDRPRFLSKGEPARLVPVLSESSAERRVASIFLAMLTQMPKFAGNFLKPAGVRVSQRTTIQAFTEVCFTLDEDNAVRPDGLIVLTSGHKVWTALVETKIGKSQIEQSQTEGYLRLARANGIDALFTISNQYVSDHRHSPVSVSNSLLNKVGLFHWSWIAIMTECEMLMQGNALENEHQAFLLDELHRFLSHPKTGVERFTHMGKKTWKDLVQAVSNGQHLRENSPEVNEAVSSWFSEERDLTLQLRRHLVDNVTSVISREHEKNPSLREKHAAAILAKSNKLKFVFRVPAAASDIEVTADIARRTITVSMKLKANLERKTSKARINWITRMLKVKDDRLQVRAYWPSRTLPTQAPLSILHDMPEKLQSDNTKLLPHQFDVMLIEEISSRRFSGSRTFIEDLERIVPEFYDVAGQHLRAWKPSPPRPKISQEAPEASIDMKEADVSPSHTAGIMSNSLTSEPLKEEISENASADIDLSNLDQAISDDHEQKPDEWDSPA